jgi:hypothetical protein
MDSLAIPYCVIGGYAVACHGVPRQTGDIDVMAIIDGDPLDVVDRLRASGHGVSITKGDLLDPLGAVITIDTQFPIQLIAAKYEYQFNAVRNATIVVYDDRDLPVASADDLILLKLKGGSPRDLEDVESIIDVQGPKLDMVSLMDKARQIKVDKRLRLLLSKMGLAAGD